MTVTTETTSSSDTQMTLVNGITLACPVCHQSVVLNEKTLSCQSCGKTYVARTADKAVQPDFRLDAEELLQGSEAENLDDTEKFQNKIKMFLRRFPGLYRFLVYVLGPALLLPPTSSQFVKSVEKENPDAQTLSIGSGVLTIKGNVTHLDYEPYPHLDVVGDAHYLPFPENTFDAVVCESMLEHVLEPDQVISEMHRVLKPGGQCYVLIPFMFGFHAAPNDFQRLTHRGLEYRMKGFDKVTLKAISGPTSALTSILTEWSAMLFSFGIRPLYQLLALVFMVIYAPLKLLDFVMTFHPEAIRIASVLLYIGKKQQKEDV